MQATISANDVNELKKAPRVDGVLDVFLDRWSPRSFANRDVSPELLHKIFEAVRWAASSYNEQPWRFLVGHKGSSAWQNIFDSLVPFNQGWAKTAPVLILGVSRNRFSHDETENRFAFFDLGAASSYIALQAAALGLRSHQMAGIDPDAARKAFGIPNEFAIGSVTALGYLGEPAALGNPGLIDNEVAPRTRKPLDEIVFSAWGQAANF